MQTGTALVVAVVTTVTVSRSQHYLAADNGANPLAALTQGYQSAFLACAVLAGIGLALAFLLPGRPRKPAHELPEPDPSGRCRCRRRRGHQVRNERANSAPILTTHAACGGDS